MRRPHLPPALFADDTILSDWSLFQPKRPRVFSGPHPLTVPLVQSKLLPEKMDAWVLGVENLSDGPVWAGLGLSDDGNPVVRSTTGGREVLIPHSPTRLFFPLESFGSYGLQAPGRKIQKIELLVRREHDLDQPIRLEVAVFFLHGLQRIRPLGPRLTEKGLAQVLNCDPDKAFGSKNKAPYNPKNRKLHIPPPVFSYPPDSPSQVLSGRIMGERIGFPPPWSANPNGELEWRHFLHRHHFLRPLVRALTRSNEKKYLLALEQGLVDWITKNPSPLDSDGGAGPAWETLSTAFRVREWLWVIGAAWNRSDFRPEVKSLLYRSIWEHAHHLMDFRGHPGNWRLLEAASLCLMGILFPEFQESGTWLETGLERLEQEASIQFFPDGVHWEISPFYQGLCAQACLEVLEAGKQAGINLPDTISTGLPKWFRTLAALYRPNFTRPSINDSGGFLDHERVLLQYAGTALHLPEVLWTGSGGRRGRPPSSKTSFFPDAGLAVLRSEVADQGFTLLFRAGPCGAAHAHQDNLSLECSVKGRPVLVDPGISRYAPSPLTRTYRRAEAHSTILITDPKPLCRTLSFQDRIGSAKDRFRRITRPGLEVISGTRRFEIPLVTRTVALVAERFAVLSDSISGTGRAAIQVHWQFAPGFDIKVGRAGNHQHVLYDQEGLIELIYLAGPPWCRVEHQEGQLDPPAGFVSHQGRDVPAPHLTCTFEVRLPIDLRWVIRSPVQEADWEIVSSGQGITFTPATGPGLVLDTTKWEISVIPIYQTNG